MSISKLNLVLFILAITVCSFVKAQSGSAGNSNGYPVDIPVSLAATTAEKSTYDILSVNDYNAEMGGNVNVTGLINKNREAKLISMTLPSRPNTSSRTAADCPQGYPACAEDCTTRPTEIGILLCTGYCMIRCIVLQN